MWFQDWTLTERMNSIRAAYRAAGVHAEIDRYEINQYQEGNLVHNTLTPFTVNAPTDTDWFWIGTTIYSDWAPRDERMTNVMVRVTVGHQARRIGSHQASATAGYLTDTGYIPIPCFVGQTTEPYFWPYPIRFVPGDFFKFELYSDGVGGGITRTGPKRFTFHGYKAFKTRAAA